MPRESPVSIRPTTSLPAWRGAHQLRLIAVGDEAALEAFHRVLADRLFSMALHWLRDEGSAREALQDTFLRIWKNAVNYDAVRSNPFTWCCMILRGIGLDTLRKRRRIPRLFDDFSPDVGLLPRLASHDGVDDLYFHDTVRRVHEALGTLSPDERETLEAALFDPASNRELADRWKLPLGSVKTRIHRAILKMRQLLSEP